MKNTAINVLLLSLLFTLQSHAMMRQSGRASRPTREICSALAARNRLANAAFAMSRVRLVTQRIQGQISDSTLPLAGIPDTLVEIIAHHEINTEVGKKARHVLAFLRIQAPNLAGEDTISLVDTVTMVYAIITQLQNEREEALMRDVETSYVMSPLFDSSWFLLAGIYASHGFTDVSVMRVLDRGRIIERMTEIAQGSLNTENRHLAKRFLGGLDQMIAANGDEKHNVNH